MNAKTIFHPPSSILHRVGKCYGLPIWKWNQLHVELWLCLSGVGPHRHPGQHNEIIPLLGSAIFARVKPGGTTHICHSQWLRAFSIPTDWLHWFETRFFVFLNVNNGGCSAAQNLQYA